MWKSSKNKTSPIPGEQSTMLSVQQEEDNHLIRSQAYMHYQERAGQWNQCNQIHFKTGYYISDSWTEQGSSNPTSKINLRTRVSKTTFRSHSQILRLIKKSKSVIQSSGSGLANDQRNVFQRTIYFSNVAQMRMILPDAVNGVLFPSLSSWQACRLIRIFKTPFSFHMSEHHSVARASEAIKTPNVVYVCGCGCVCVRVWMCAWQPWGESQCCVSCILVSLSGQPGGRQGLSD